LKKQFKALANPARIEILNLLSDSLNGGKKDNGNGNKELNVRIIVDNLPLSPSTISHHLNILKKADIVRSRKDKQWVYYSINRETLEKMQDFLSKL